MYQLEGIPKTNEVIQKTKNDKTFQHEFNQYLHLQ